MCCGRCQGVSGCVLSVASIVQAGGAVRPSTCSSTRVHILAQRVCQHAAVQLLSDTTVAAVPTLGYFVPEVLIP
jgi:hypothetical protein